MLKNNLLPKIAFLLPKKENLPMHLVQIISFIFMIAIFDSHGFTDSDTSFLIAEPIRENQKLGTWWGIGCPLIFKGLYLINHNLITFNSLFKIQTVFYVFFLGKICLILFKNKNIKLSVFLFLITFYSPFLFLHILLGFSLLFILDFTLRINKSYSSSTLINNDILTIITLGGNIRDKDINYYAHKYIDKIGGINGKSEEIYYGTKSIKDFDSLNSEQKEEIIFVRYLISGHDSGLLKKEEFKSRITSFEENRAYIKKVWLYAVIDNPIIYLQHKILYIKFVFKNKYKLRSDWLFNNSKPVRDFLIHTLFFIKLFTISYYIYLFYYICFIF